MSETPNFDAKVKEILDNLKPHERARKLTGEKWMMDAEEISWIKKFNVPPPKIHPVNRVKITVSFATGFGWWWGKHPNTGEKVLTYVHPATGLKSIPDPEFFEQDRTDKARDYDSNASFFDQIRELQKEVPLAAWRSLNIPVNSIALLSEGDENSYFVTVCKSKNSFYSYGGNPMESSAEVYESEHITDSYSVLNSHRVHNCKFIRQCYDLINCDFMFDCRNCENCFCSTNKRNKKFLWFNEQLKEEEWKKRRSDVDLGSTKQYNETVAKFRELMSSDKTVWPENFNEQTENCIGEFLYKCRDCKYIYQGHDSNNNFHGAIFLGKNEGNAFLGGAIESQNNYYSHSPLKSSGCKFVHSCYQCQNMEYSMQCYNCEDCFGCVGLNRKKFCIFNKQYGKDEYWKRLDEIKTNMLDRGEYGDFFPLSFSPCYVLASPGLVYLLDREEVLKLGGLDIDPDSHGALGQEREDIEIRSQNDLPDHINDMDPDEWTGAVAVMDNQEGRKFSYIKPELALYKKLGIRAPERHSMWRLRNLVYEANSALFMDDVCRKCGKKIIVAKNKNYPERNIYCKSCYFDYLETNG